MSIQCMSGLGVVSTEYGSKEPSMQAALAAQAPSALHNTSTMQLCCMVQTLQENSESASGQWRAWTHMEATCTALAPCQADVDRSQPRSSSVSSAWKGASTTRVGSLHGCQALELTRQQAHAFTQECVAFASTNMLFAAFQ